ncbi:MAG: nucleotidyltransferase domain-containing protein [Dictyoglomaceae bacterium]|nr:nucleotidyltransferase domain-containing protein [Dictyoglomaceae bacterium]
MKIREKEIAEKILKEAKSLYDENLIALGIFGSFARGEFSQSSDIDLIIIIEEAEKNIKRYKDFYNLETSLGIEINPIVLSVEEAKIFHSIYLSFLDGLIILYDKLEILKRIVEKLYEFLEKDILEKNETRGVFYWRIKNEEEVSKGLF